MLWEESRIKTTEEKATIPLKLRVTPWLNSSIFFKFVETGGIIRP